MASNNEVRPGIYRHYKGKMYRVVGMAKHSETLDDLVIYEALYNNELSKLWVRPAEMFAGEVDRDGESVKRFTRLDDDNSNNAINNY